ncbi:outer membrane beta-barrel family protein [Alkalitalea saponilacus]|uniref:Outer membrane receptor proteins, mostly Fe transport n=1 Tax=Alkalitalea saponilacus TaxID=889453 RepID=A0A1T5HU22_9BACT|nr:outer membrane beta-barrel family protein [Alkalitalea saponilacus]ASB50515.1 TonB-dependent receptor [Alkalitalea saponilacus]SKC24152.1 Outer membrane receptor proteins, mostly Fe transport [Alkalitalea saponilacus]
MDLKRATVLFISFLLFNQITIFSQNRVIGYIKDAQAGSAVEFAQAALMQPSDSSLITGGLSDARGRFEIQTSNSGELILRLSYIGYEELYQTIEVSSGTNRLGEINLAPAVTELGEVQITAAAALFRSEADRRIYNVENITIAEGGTAVQLLETLPSIQVDEEGSISMRGSGNILIYINGRPTNLSSDDTESILEQFPANAIKEVELITNPSARYDAEGVGGIINIILREQRLQGMNGQFNLSLGTGNKYTAGTNLNMRQNRWNHFLSYSYQYRELWEENDTWRETSLPGYSPIVDQDYYTENFNHSHLVRVGTEYEINDNSSVRAYSSINARGRDRERIYNIRNLSAPNMLDSMYTRLLEEDQSRVNYEFGAGYNFNNGNGQILNLNASAAWDSQDRIEYFTQNYFIGDLGGEISEVPEKFEDQFYERPLTSRMMVFEADYEQNIGSALKMETGLKATLRNDDRSQSFGWRHEVSEPYQERILNGIPVNNQFIRDENIYGAFLILSNNNNNENGTNRFSYMAGLRAELSEIKTFQESGLRSGFLNDDTFIPAVDTSTTNHYFDLFPSIFLSYEISPNQDIQANYSRRIRRPGVGAMMPFLNAQDFYNLRLGNPYLEAAYTNNYELNYIRAWERYMVTGSIFHRHTTNGITRLFVPFEQGTMVTWTNAATTNSTGFELINYFTLNSNFDATLTGNYFYSMVEGQLEGSEYKNESYSWNLNLLTNMNIPGWFRTQLSTSYWGPRVIPQGEIKPVFSMNIGLRRNVLNNQGTISLNVSDVFNSRRFTLETNDGNVYQKRDFTRESQVATISFTWRFRNFREQQERTGPNGIDGDIDGLF